MDKFNKCTFLVFHVFRPYLCNNELNNFSAILELVFSGELTLNKCICVCVTCSHVCVVKVCIPVCSPSQRPEEDVECPALSLFHIFSLRQDLMEPRARLAASKLVSVLLSPVPTVLGIPSTCFHMGNKSQT